MQNRLHNLWLKCKALFRRRALDRDLEDEMSFHLSMRAEKNRDRGMDFDEARYAARRQFGNLTSATERSREMWKFNLIESFWADIRYGARTLRKNSGFTAVAVLTLALGIGANTAIFSVVYAALLRPLPYEMPSQLITLGEYRPQQDAADPQDPQNWVASYPDYLDWAQQSKSFRSLAGFSEDGFIYRATGEPQLVNAAQVTTNFFSTLGVQPFLGRGFEPGEDLSSGPKVAILTYNFWISQFAGDPHVLGRSMQLDSNSAVIVGVLPRSFEFAPVGSAEIWVPMHLGNEFSSRRNLRWMRVLGRLHLGVSPSQAQSEMNSINSSLASAYPQANGSIQVAFVPLRQRIVGRVESLLLVLLGAVGLVLLIACGNVASLLLVRAASRRREFAIRSALGAARIRLISQLLAESMILSLSGAALGLLLAGWGTSLLVAAIPENLLDATPFFRDAHANPAVLAFLSLIAILTGLIFGLSPALHLSQDRAGDALKEESRASASGSRARLRKVFVVVEVAFSLVLLVGAGLMVKSLATLLHRDPGFDSRDLVTFAINLPDSSYPNDSDVIRFNREFARRVEALSGITGLASNSIIPLTGGGNSVRFAFQGESAAAGQESECDIRNVSANYFSMLKIPLLSGRFFNDSDDITDGPKHVVVNQSFVRRFLHDENPVGKQLRFTFSPKQTYREIVGVVGDYADAGLDSPPQPAVFVPFLQGPNSYRPYVARYSGNSAAAISSLRSLLRELDAQLVMLQPQTIEQIVDQSPAVFLRRYPSYLIGSFAALALILAVVGLYGLISYSVAQRTRELGVRIALGAGRSDVLRLVLGEAARLALTGVLFGLAAALGLMQLVRGLLFGVSPADPLTFVGVSLLLCAVAFAASYIPARRASAVDPIVALRYE